VEFRNRRVVVGHDDQGQAAVLSDGPAPGLTRPDGGSAFSTVLWIDHRPLRVEDGGDPPVGPVALEPPVGGVCSRVIRLPPPPPGVSDDERWLRVGGDDPARPGMHTTDTLDFVVIIDGEIVLGLDDGEYHLGAGDVVVQGGAAHRWRVVGDGPCTYAATLVRPDPSAPPPVAALIARRQKGVPSAGTSGEAKGGPRRIVTGTGAEGTSYAVADGTPPMVIRPGQREGSMMADLWQTGGPVVRCDQGGDVEGEWRLDPAGMGVAFRMVEWPPDGDPGARGWHATSSIDIDFILSGELELELRNLPTIRLGRGDVVVQRGTEHLWRPAGAERVRMAAVMIGIDPPH
jgi:quercetin dioxygenase-like cupin family protein